MTSRALATARLRLRARLVATRATTVTPPPHHGTMATPLAQLAKVASEYGSDVDMQSVASLSDYGSDISLGHVDEDSALVGGLDTIQQGGSTEKGAALPSIEFKEGEREDEEQHVDGRVQKHVPALLRVGKGRRDIQCSPLKDEDAPGFRRASRGASCMSEYTWRPEPLWCLWSSSRANTDSDQLLHQAQSRRAAATRIRVKPVSRSLHCQS